MSRHVIETLTWICQGRDRQGALAQQQRLSEFLRGEGARVLERMFDRLSPSEEVWRIDRLEIDLGRLPADADDRRWAVALEQTLDTTLRRARQQAEGDRDRDHAPRRHEDQDLENFLHYLRHGHLHWSMPTTASSMADWLERLARRNGARLWEILQRLPQADQALVRLGHITPCHGLQALLASRHADLAQSLTALDDVLLEPLRAQGRLSPYVLNQVRQAWRVAGLHALWGQGGSHLSVSRVQQLMTALGQSLLLSLGSARSDEVSMLSPPSGSSALLRSLMLGLRWRLSGAVPEATRRRVDHAARGSDASAAEDSPAERLLLDVGWHESLRQFALAHQQAAGVRAAGLSLSMLQSYLLDYSLAYLHDADHSPQDHVAWRRVWQDALDLLACDVADAVDALAGDGSRPRGPSAETPERPRVRNHRNDDGTVSPADDHPDNEAIYVANAGLVLLANFAPRLFTMLELVRDGDFVDLAARHRAVHCLVYLTDGQLDSEEHEWVLNKLLCGVPIDEPVPPAKSIESIRELLDSLLNAVIQHWSALGSTTPAGLRQTFLRRIGRLVEHDSYESGHWRLKVQPSSFDVLLDRLPWSYGTIKLPWMKGAVHVDWR